jgi:hypothetical protein
LAEEPRQGWKWLRFIYAYSTTDKGKGTETERKRRFFTVYSIKCQALALIFLSVRS